MKNKYNDNIFDLKKKGRISNVKEVLKIHRPQTKMVFLL